MDAGNKIRFTPLSGVHSETPLSYLLDIDGFKILLDCGWNDKLDLADIQSIVE
jgi:cleavage and polyadenylation specificity factor subunit 2